MLLGNREIKIIISNLTYIHQCFETDTWDIIHISHDTSKSNLNRQVTETACQVQAYSNYTQKILEKPLPLCDKLFYLRFSAFINLSLVSVEHNNGKGKTPYSCYFWVL